MNAYLIVWRDHTSTVVKGSDIGSAYIRSGYGGNDFLRVKDYYPLSQKENKSFKEKLEELSES